MINFNSTKDHVLEAVKQDGCALRYAHPDLRKDKDVVLEAVKQNGWALEFAHVSLRNDKDVVLAAVKQNGWAFRYAHRDLRKNKDLIFEARNNIKTTNDHTSGLGTFILDSLLKGNLEALKDLHQKGVKLDNLTDLPIVLNIKSWDIKHVTDEAEIMKYLAKNFKFLIDCQREKRLGLNMIVSLGEIETLKYIVNTGKDIKKNFSDKEIVISAINRPELIYIENVIMQSIFFLAKKNILRRHEKSNRKVLTAVPQKTIKSIEYTDNFLEKKMMEHMTKIVAAGFGATSGFSFDGYSALHIASWQGNLELIDFLVERGFEIDKPNPKGNTALMSAVADGDLKTVKCLVEYGANINTTCNYREKAKGSLLMLIIQNRFFNKVFKEYKNLSSDFYSIYNDYRVDYYPFDNRNDWFINKISTVYGWPLPNVQAIMEKTETFIFSDKTNFIKTLKYLVNKGLDINQPGDDGRRPLDLAIECGDMKIVKYLVENGAEINTTMSPGLTPLHLSVLSRDIKIFKYLVKQGADINAPDNDGETALSMAVEMGEDKIVKYLVKNEAKIDTVDAEGYTPLFLAIVKNNIKIVKYLLKNGAEINEVDANGHTPLFFAEKAGHLHIAKYLKRNGGEIHTSNVNNNMPFIVEERGYPKILKDLTMSEKNISRDSSSSSFTLNVHKQKDKAMDKLTNTSINIFNSDMYDDLTSAARNGDIATIQCLLEKGINIDGIDANTDTALIVAVQHGKTNIVRYLVENGASLVFVEDGICNTDISDQTKKEIKDIIGAAFYADQIFARQKIDAYNFSCPSTLIRRYKYNIRCIDINILGENPFFADIEFINDNKDIPEGISESLCAFLNEYVTQHNLEARSYFA